MSHTIRKYPAKIRAWRVRDKDPVAEGRDGALLLEKSLKRADRYVGWTDEGIWSPEAKKRNKRKVERENRHKMNAAIRHEVDDDE
jgi:hypothetical protein